MALCQIKVAIITGQPNTSHLYVRASLRILVHSFSATPTRVTALAEVQLRVHLVGQQRRLGQPRCQIRNQQRCNRFLQDKSCPLISVGRTLRPATVIWSTWRQSPMREIVRQTVPSSTSGIAAWAKIRSRELPELIRVTRRTSSTTLCHFLSNNRCKFKCSQNSNRWRILRNTERKLRASSSIMAVTSTSLIQ